MIRVGDEDAGFAVERAGAEARIRAWGFWSIDVAERFELALTSVFHAFGGPSVLVLDIAELKPMRDEGQRAWSRLFSLVRSSGLGSVRMIEPSALTKLQFMRLSRSIGVPLTIINRERVPQ